ncbi:MAG: hypothetical protein EOP73_30730, partial [Variovorax sp.]
MSVNSASVGTPVVDYAAQALVVPTGAGSGVTLTMDGQRGELLEARGTLKVDAYGFFQVAGSFALTKSTETVTLADGDQVTVDMLTMGADGVDAFAGIDGGKPEAIGLKLDDVGFALALMREQLTASSPSVARQWSALQAHAGSAALVGVSGITAQASAVQVLLNRASADGQVVDFASSPIDVATGPGLGITFDMDGQDGATLSAVGEFAIDVKGFFQASGTLAIERRVETVYVADLASTVNIDESAEIEVDLLTLGGAGLDAFVGSGGGTAAALGVAIGNVEFGLALLAERNGTRSWSSLQASAGSVALVGIDGLTLAADSLAIAINTTAADGTVIDHAAAPLQVATGPDGAVLDLDLDGAAGALL